ncbi:hypothetical protein IB233_04610 [Comamonas sp. CMM01]|uniref:hypothetical protein n=1 Tax=Comamonas sp. CMM01 TaxID=2769280 RepID=UPI00177F24F1|nr:hypothetical protein [Comamonas sp. CMM01]MBD9530918.1 hypothetical protein [Comamonas sp. CMM01]
MSKPNEKTAQPAKASTGPSDLAMVSAAPAAQAVPDQNHGRGGIYTVVNGVRQRIGGTEQTKAKKD